MLNTWKYWDSGAWSIGGYSTVIFWTVNSDRRQLQVAFPCFSCLQLSSASEHIFLWARLAAPLWWLDLNLPHDLWYIVHYYCTYVAQVPQQTLVHRLTTLKELHSLSRRHFVFYMKGNISWSCIVLLDVCSARFLVLMPLWWTGSSRAECWSCKYCPQGVEHHALSVHLDLRCLTKILLLNILTILIMVDILFLDPFDTLLVVIRLFL